MITLMLPQNTTQLISDLNWLANQFVSLGGWDALLASGILSPIGLGIKKLSKIDNGEVMLWLIGAGSLFAGFIVYLMTTPQHDPTIIAFLGLITFLGTQPFYKLALKPLSGWLGGQMAEAERQVQEQRNPAAVPPEGLPVIGK